MNGFCANAATLHPRIFSAVVMVFALAAPGAVAQDGSVLGPGAPVRLAPPQPLSPALESLAPSLAPLPAAERPEAAIPPATTPPATTPPATTPPEAALPGAGSAPQGSAIKIGTLGVVDPNSVGVLDAGSGGFGIDMWNGTGASLVARLLSGLDKPAAFPAAQSLLRRLLLSAARPPRQKTAPATPEKAGAAQGPSLLARRLDRLLVIGDVMSARALIRLVPSRLDEEAVALAQMNTAFLLNDIAGACGEAKNRIRSYQGEPWLKSRVFCEQLEGEANRAAIGVGLLREQGVADAAFFALVGLMAGDKDSVFEAPRKLTPLHLAMMRAARVQIPETVMAGADAILLRAIAFSPNAALDVRLDAAERAEARGGLKSESLTELYNAVNFAPGDIAAALTGADKLAGPRGRALLYHAARAQTVPAARAELLAKAFILARSQGRGATAIRAFLPLLLIIKPADELAWFAAEAGAALYFAGRHADAAPWADLARRKPYTEAKPPAAPAGPSAPPDAAGDPKPVALQPEGDQPAPPMAVSSELKLWPFTALAAVPVVGPAKAETAKAETEEGAASAAKSKADAMAAVSGRAAPSGGILAASGTVPGSAEAGVGGSAALNVMPEALNLIPQSMGTTVEREELVVKPLPAPKPATTKSDFDEAMFARWVKAQEAEGKVVAEARSALLLTLLDALGTDIPQSAWLKTANTRREAASLPAPGLIAALRIAARAGRVGETVLLTLVVLGADEPERLHPAVVGPVVRALVAAGLAKEARALAVEIAFGAGI